MPPDLLVAMPCGSHVFGGVLLLLLCRLVVVDACLVRVVGLGREDGMRQVQREWGGWLGKGGDETCVRAAQRPETGSSAQDLSTLPTGV